VLKPLESWGANAHTYDASFGTDNFDFLLEGVPTLVANQEEANYLPNYHAASDTLDKVDMRELKLHTALAALTVWASPTATEPLGKRLTRAELDILVKETGLDQQLKLLGYWDAWKAASAAVNPRHSPRYSPNSSASLASLGSIPYLSRELPGILGECQDHRRTEHGLRRSILAVDYGRARIGLALADRNPHGRNR